MSGGKVNAECNKKCFVSVLQQIRARYHGPSHITGEETAALRMKSLFQKHLAAPGLSWFPDQGLNPRAPALGARILHHWANQGSP